MAELKRIVQSNPLSTFRQTGPEGGVAFAALADMANQAYDFMKPAALAQMGEEGAAAGREMARRQVGQNRIPFADPEFGGAGETGDLNDVGRGIVETAESLGMDPLDLGTIISYETGGTFDPVKIGPKTKWGTHRGLIQFGEPQAKQYGVDWSNPLASQLGADGAIARYFRDRGYKPGMGILDAYSIVNAGGPGLSHRSDTAAGGAPGTVKDKVGGQMSGHRAKAADLLRMAQRGGLDMGTDAAPAATSISSQDTPAPTLVMTESGAVEPRMYSPMSGEILQAHNAAAATAYLAEMNLAGRQDIMALGSQFPLDPDGFKEAVRGYVDQQVSAAPREMREDLRANLERDAQSRYFGMLEDKQSDTRRRADNTSKALVDRWSKDYADALASGDEGAAAGARSRLEDLLVNREALPGIGWTRAQSENVILDAMDAAETIRGKRRKQWSDDTKSSLNTIIDAAKKGRHASDEAMLDDQRVWAEHPELAREAAAMAALRDAMPGFTGKTPAEREAIIGAERGRAVGSEWELDILDAMEASHNDALDEAEDDLVGWARENMDVKPPELPADVTDPANVDKTVQALTARKDWAIGATRAGYTDAPVFFSKDERNALAPFFTAGADPAMKAAAAATIVSAFGTMSGAALTELKADDVTRQVGGLMGAGVGPALGQKALVGQQMLDEGLVMVPTKATQVDAISPDIAAALPGAPALQGRVLKTAQAIYAASARGVDHTSDEAADLMASALQEALGYEEHSSRRKTGGVQPINGSMTLLPPGITPQAVEGGMIRAVGHAGVGRGGADKAADPARWGGNGVPSYDGQPLRIRDLFGANFIPVTTETGDVVDGMYFMEIAAPNGAPTDVENEAGHRFIFNMRALAAR